MRSYLNSSYAMLQFNFWFLKTKSLFHLIPTHSFQSKTRSRDRIHFILNHTETTNLITFILKSPNLTIKIVSFAISQQTSWTFGIHLNWLNQMELFSSTKLRKKNYPIAVLYYSTNIFSFLMLHFRWVFAVRVYS